MRKLFLIVTLFMSSFFFFNYKIVFAYEYNYNFDPNEFNLLNDNFKFVRNWAINFANENDKYYIIQFRDNNYRVYFLPKENIDINKSSMGFKATKYYSEKIISYNYINNEFVLYDNSSTGYSLIVEKTSSSSPIYYYRYLDTNSSDFIYKGDDVFNISIDDFTYTLNSNDKFLSLYEISVLKNGEELPPDHKDETLFLTNFYTLCIEKINLLANLFTENYIFLSIIVMFILFFIFELVFRRLL